MRSVLSSPLPRAGALLFLTLLIASCLSDVKTEGPGSNSEKFFIDPDTVQWEQTSGPEGGDFKQIELNRKNPQTVVAGNMRSVYRSSDGGNSWNLVLDDIRVLDIESSMQNPDTIYLAGQTMPHSQSVFYRSEDGGSSWEQLVSGDEIHRVQNISTVPDNPAVLYMSCAEPAHLLKSTDKGISWKEITRFEEEDISAFGVVREGTIILGAGEL